MTKHEREKKFKHGTDIDQEIHTKTSGMLEQINSEGGRVSQNVTQKLFYCIHYRIFFKSLKQISIFLIK